jgi:hypothetical protein
MICDAQCHKLMPHAPLQVDLSLLGTGTSLYRVREDDRSTLGLVVCAKFLVQDEEEHRAVQCTQ